eukprot:6214832-Pleurochrysis_carterae.AAC.3
MEPAEISALRLRLEELQGMIIIVSENANENGIRQGEAGDIYNPPLLANVPNIPRHFPSIHLLRESIPEDIYSHEDIEDSAYIRRAASTNIYDIDLVAISKRYDQVNRNAPAAKASSKDNIIQLVTDLGVAVMIADKYNEHKRNEEQLKKHNLLYGRYRAMIPPHSEKNFVKQQLKAGQTFRKPVYLHDVILRRMLSHIKQSASNDFSRIPAGIETYVDSGSEEPLPVYLHIQRVFLLGHMSPVEVCTTINFLRPIPIVHTFDGASSARVLTLAYARGEVLWMENTTKFVGGDEHTSVPLFVRSLRDLFTKKRILMSEEGLENIQHVDPSDVERLTDGLMLHKCEYPVSTQAIFAPNLGISNTDGSKTVSACYWTCEYPMNISYSELCVLKKISPENHIFESLLFYMDTSRKPKSCPSQQNVVMISLQVKNGSMQCSQIVHDATSGNYLSTEGGDVFKYEYKSANVLIILLDITLDELLQIDISKSVCAPNLVGAEETNVCVLGQTHGVYMHPHVQALFPFVHNLFIMESTNINILSSGSS